MEEESIIKIGKLLRVHGLKGEVRGMIDQEFIPRIKKLEVLFLMFKNNPLPHFPEYYDLDETGACLFKFEEVNDRTQAEKLSGKEIFIDKKYLKKNVKEVGFNFLVGYQLIDSVKGEVGEIENIFELPAHPIAQLRINSKEVLIPMTEETIVKIDKRKKEVTVIISEGLIDMYLK